MKKFLPYILILGLVLMIGVFTLNSNAEAQTVNCSLPSNQSNPVCTGSAAVIAPGLPLPTNGLENNLPGCLSLASGTVPGCIINIAYYLFFALPAFLLTLTAKLFDAMIPITLSSMMYTQSSFIPEAWRIVRDFSNIFFILALLYTAIKVILSIDTAGVKKAVVNIVIAALLINFSMFMTQVVIDSSNILALIFYNKISVKIENPQNITPINSQPVFDPKKTGVEEKSISYALTSSFNPTALIDRKIFEAHKGSDANTVAGWVWAAMNPTMAVVGGITGGDPIANYFGGKPPNMNFYLALIFVSCAIFLVASYAFFIAMLAFFGRLIELWMLIIFSPFAFMSLSVPKLQQLEYLGFDAWFKRLVSVAFMAPLFMFFILLISKLIQINPIANLTLSNLTPGLTSNIQFYILMIIPTMISLALLLKAVKFAKEGSGQFGELIIKYGQVAAAAVGGLAIGAATGGVGLAATATLGRAGASLATSSALKTSASQGGLSGLGAKALMNLGSFASKSSFDARKIGVVGKTMGKMGMSAEPSAITKALGLNTEGGVIGMRKRAEEKDIERAREIGKVGDHEQEAVEERRVKNAYQDVLLKEVDDGTGREVSSAEMIRQLKVKLEGAEKAAASAARELNTAKDTPNEDRAREKSQKANAKASDIKIEIKAIEDSNVGVLSDGRMVDYTKVSTTGAMSDTAAQNMEEQAISARAEANAAAAPGAPAALAARALELERTAQIAEAMRDAARATKAVTEAEKARLEAEQNPHDATLAAASVRAEATKVTALHTANTSAGIIRTLAAAVPAYANKATIVTNLANNATMGLGRSINNLEKVDIPYAEEKRHHKGKERERAFAESLNNPSKIQKIFMPILGDSQLAREVRAHKIREGAKEKH